MRGIWILLLAVGCAAQPNFDLPGEDAVAVDRDAVIGAGIAALRGKDELVWGVTPFLEDDVLLGTYVPIVEAVHAELGIPGRVVVPDDYADLEARLEHGEIDVAVVSPYSYVRTKRKDAGVQVFASHIGRGSVSYGSYIITASDDIHSLDDLRGRRFGYVDLRSTSGWLFPAARLIDAGVHPLKDVQPAFFGSHTRLLDAVVSGEVDAGATYGGAMAEGRLRNPGAMKLRVVAKGPRIPHDAYAVRSGLPPEVPRALALILASINTGTARGREMLSTRLFINGFLPVDDDHFDAIREIEAELQAAGFSIEG